MVYGSKSKRDWSILQQQVQFKVEGMERNGWVFFGDFIHRMERGTWDFFLMYVYVSRTTVNGKRYFVFGVKGWSF